MPAHKVVESNKTSDWECTNCGATLTGVNNSEIHATTPFQPRCICNSGTFFPTRNNPFTKSMAGKANQHTNEGGGISFPGP